MKKLAIAALVVGLLAPLLLRAADVPAGPMTSGWSLLKEGEAEGTMEQNAPHPVNPSTTLLKIVCTKHPDPGKGRVGATNSATFEVKADKYYDVTFSAATLQGTIGLVFSLETADGKVLARTTLPEIGRMARGRGGQPAGANAAVNWPKYLVALHARDSAAGAHLTITPIEPTTIWLENITVTERAEAK